MTGNPDLLRGLDIGPRIFPAEHDEAGDGALLRDGAAKNLGKRRGGHLNFAIMSLMPGIVSI